MNIFTNIPEQHRYRRFLEYINADKVHNSEKFFNLGCTASALNLVSFLTSLICLFFILIFGIDSIPIVGVVAGVAYMSSFYYRIPQRLEAFRIKIYPILLIYWSQQFSKIKEETFFHPEFFDIYNSLLNIKTQSNLNSYIDHINILVKQYEGLEDYILSDISLKYFSSKCLNLIEPKYRNKYLKRLALNRFVEFFYFIILILSMFYSLTGVMIASTVHNPHLDFIIQILFYVVFIFMCHYFLVANTIIKSANMFALRAILVVRYLRDQENDFNMLRFLKVESMDEYLRIVKIINHYLNPEQGKGDTVNSNQPKVKS